MKSKNTKKEETTVRNNLKIKLMVIGITTISVFTFMGCHDQTASVETKSFNYPVLANESTPKSLPAQLVSKVTFKNISDENISTVNNEDKISPAFEEVASRYYSSQALESKRNNGSWKDTYDGIGIPILKISF